MACWCFGFFLGLLFLRVVMRMEEEVVLAMTLKLREVDNGCVITEIKFLYDYTGIVAWLSL